MINQHDAVTLLKAKREELLNQLKAVDKALEALSDFGPPVAPAREAEPEEPEGEAASTVVPTRLKAPRTLSDEHKHALKEGRRKARHASDVAAGIARELSGLPPGLASASGAGPQPRLVKRKRS